MKLKHLFYNTKLLWGQHSYFTMKGWLRYKDSILNVKRYMSVILVRYGIKLQPKRRHRITSKSMTTADFLIERFIMTHFLTKKKQRTTLKSLKDCER